VVQLAKRRADLENEIDLKLKELRDSHEKERERLEADCEAKKQKLNEDYQQYVSMLFLFGKGKGRTFVIAPLCRHGPPQRRLGTHLPTPKGWRVE